MIQERRAQGNDVEQKRGKKDLLGALIQASAGAQGDVDEEEQKSGGEKPNKTGFAKLTDREVMGNIYVFLLAGHGESRRTEQKGMYNPH